MRSCESGLFVLAVRDCAIGILTVRRAFLIAHTFFIATVLFIYPQAVFHIGYPGDRLCQIFGTAFNITAFYSAAERYYTVIYLKFYIRRIYLTIIAEAVADVFFYTVVCAAIAFGTFTS